jgi:endonuclease-3
MALPLPALPEITRALRRQHREVPLPTPPPRNAFEWVLWENVAYLTDEAKRLEAFKLLKKSVGTAPADILGADNPTLLRVTRHGIVPELFARKLRTSAELARDKFGGKLDAALSTDLAKASRQLRAFPGIGEPGAEKILVATGRARTLPLDSNGLRVLLRIGFGQALRSYQATYRSVKAALPVGRASAKALFAAHLLLQRHGREVCKASAPQCGRCLLRPVCAYGSMMPA